jgi:hypothetical protein
MGLNRTRGQTTQRLDWLHKKGGGWDGLGGDISGFGACAGVRVRIRWSQALLALFAAVGILLALRAAPSLLTPPAPPPLPADVGLPRGEASARGLAGAVDASRAEPGSGRRIVRDRPRLGRVVSGGGDRRRAEAAEGRASKRQAQGPGARSSAQHKPTTPTRRQDPPATTPVPSPVPPPESVPIPAPEPVPVPAPPNDGSMEFAPH